MTEIEYTVTESAIRDLLADSSRGIDALYQRLGNGEHVDEREWEQAYRRAYHQLEDSLRGAIIDSIKAVTDELVRQEFHL
ncbi:hypothetical protein [Rhodococcus ruber]|uniref:hypothetical protein n=1 Tax=Rhodococcus ruber TaxID=1830 RepID=UPI0026601EEF|nr:hypothetical protein [Rhodococcus ruber]MDO1481426.1 hypothetical protein [Rhodococcus ruber]